MFGAITGNAEQRKNDLDFGLPVCLERGVSVG
jgi:hypothetical protein